MFEWKDEPFELIMFLRNLPKIACSKEVIDCSRSLHLAHKSKIEPEKTKLGLDFQSYAGMRFWMTVIGLHFIYYILSITIFPKLKQF
jgi:hypothetical protein